MKIQVKTAIMSHLSDAQHLIDAGYPEEANLRINFVKLILLTYKNDILQEVDEEELDNLWLKLTQNL